MTLEEITEALTFDTRPSGPDGCSNVDRIHYIGRVFGLEVIDLNAEYDFTSVIDEDDPVIVQAAKHLALLKLDYLNRLFNHYQVTKEGYDSATAPLILAVQRINWHLSHIKKGVPTPPFPAY